MQRLRVSILGGSGYVGGELLRLILAHPRLEVGQISSRRWAGVPLHRVLPQMPLDPKLCFVHPEEMGPSDLLILALPHGESMKQWERVEALAPRIIDMGADFRLRDAGVFAHWYGGVHQAPEALDSFVYGLPEILGEDLGQATWVACPGCNATASILALWPFRQVETVERGRTVVQVLGSSSQAGRQPSLAGHFSERSGSVRVFAPQEHRHTAELMQALAWPEADTPVFSVVSLPLVRGILAMVHLFFEKPLRSAQVHEWFREAYAQAPMVRWRSDPRSLHRWPDPRLCCGTNRVDLGFQLDRTGRKLVVMAALDNLVRGAAGQAIHNLNLMMGFAETEGLPLQTLFP